ncbi:uncharacterized protein RAG0_10170 [Rhynchosporium agropyri]|uniref:Uncharacterized protein n=1 Tax=Rhynchosporium agropyri TaxID=914238 RepID=A0A1E1KYS7_9HELO|nr:uncharacterized protein RAG0_10170 [Rhynchosporium agropyri]
MKTNFLVYMTAIMISTNALAAPSTIEHATRDVAEVSGDLSILADNCFHKSICSKTWSGKGEGYCDKRKFSHMTRNGCGWNPLKQAVCCVKP